MHIEYVYIYSFILKNALSHNPISKLKSSSEKFILKNLLFQQFWFWSKTLKILKNIPTPRSQSQEYRDHPKRNKTSPCVSLTCGDIQPRVALH